MSKPIENCPQPETPIRERAWTAEQAEQKATFAEKVGFPEMAAMLRAYAATLRQQGEQAGGVVSDEGLAWALRGAANYIDKLGGDSRGYRIALQAAIAQNAQGEAVASSDLSANLRVALSLVKRQRAQIEALNADRARVPNARTGVYVTHDDAVTLREIRLAQPPSLRDSAFIGRPLLAIAQRIEATMLAAAEVVNHDA